jgi:hypothetical protein
VASVSATLEVLLGVALGTLSWYCGFALVVAALRVRLGGLMLGVVDVATGVALVGYGGILCCRSVQEG